MSWLSSLLKPVSVEPLELTYQLDVDDAGHHTVRVFKTVDGESAWIPITNELLTYGYAEHLDDGFRILVLDPEDQQRLQAIKSAKPTLTEDGSAHFDTNPRVVSYLRARGCLQESEQSRRLRLTERRLVPTALLDFVPGSGLHLKTGLAFEGEHEIVPMSALPDPSEAGFMRIGDDLATVPQNLSPDVQEFLQHPDRQIPLAEVPDFWRDEKPRLEKQLACWHTAAVKKLSFHSRASRPNLGLSMDEPGWIGLRLGCEMGGQHVPLEVLEKIGDQGWAQLDDFTWLEGSRATTALVQGVRDLDGERTTDGDIRIPASKIGALETFIDKTGIEPDHAPSYTAFLAELQGFNHDYGFALSDAFERRLVQQGIHLRPYQRAGIHWLAWLQRNRLQGVLADDMGLGKTIETACTLRLAYEATGSRKPSLVVAPLSVVRHWEREIKRCAPLILVRRYHGPGRLRSRREGKQPVIYVTTYPLIPNDIDMLRTIPFLYVVIDEATNIKNPDTKRAKAIKMLDCEYRLALSGTPVENHPRELWSIFDFLMHGHLGRLGTFERVFSEQVLRGETAATEALGKRIRPFVLRRMKDEVATDLPAKIEIEEWCPLTEEQRDLYMKILMGAADVQTSIRQGAHVSVATSILPILTKLKQVCDHPAIVNGRWTPLEGRSNKFDWVVEKIGQIVNQHQQVVVFSHFLGSLDLLQQAIERMRFGFIRIDGGTTNRQSLIDRFNDGGASVALCSLRAAGHGINLQSANNVIHVDRWWNPAVEDQATDRVHRIGQNQNVYVYRIMCEGTLEERIVNILERKRDMTGRIMDAANQGVGGWTREELLEVLRPLD